MSSNHLTNKKTLEKIIVCYNVTFQTIHFEGGRNKNEKEQTCKIDMRVALD